MAISKHEALRTSEHPSPAALMKHNHSETTKNILVKKYPNRRLYDVTHSQYMTQEELIDWIRNGHDVVVVDSKTQQDITQYVLTQILLERGKNGTYLFSSPFLHQLIRNRDGILAEFFTDFVPKLLESYLEMKDVMRRQFSTIASPVSWLTTTTKDLRMNLMNPLNLPSQSAEKLEKTETEAPQEIMALRERIRQLEARLEENKRP